MGERPGQPAGCSGSGSPCYHCSSPDLGSAGRFEASVIEERRKGAEDLLRFTVPIPALNNSPQLKEFFRVSLSALPTSLAPLQLPSLPATFLTPLPSWTLSLAGWGGDTAL